MADSLSLLFKLRGDSSGVKTATAESRAAIKQLRTDFGSEIGQMNAVATRAFGSVTTSFTNFSGQLPVVGAGVRSVTGALEGSSVAAAGFAGAIGLTVAAIGAAVVGVAALSKELFDAVKQTAEWQGKFFDLSQQVGVTVETLSTLDVAASTTGGNIESVSASMGIFQKHLEAAHDPTSKEAKLLTELGVTSLDTEVALRQTLKGLFAMGEGAKQTDAVLTLFGRSGRFVNAILKETKGDLDAATDKFSRMGLVVSTQAAAAADQFNDSLEILSRQLASITRSLVSDTIPLFVLFFEEISKALTGNKNDWQSWGRVIETTVATAAAAIQAFVQFVASRFTLDFGLLLESNFDIIIKRAQALRNELFAQAEIEKFGRLTDQILGRSGTVGDRPDANKARTDARTRANKALQLEQQALEEQSRLHREALERDRQLDLKSIDEWQKESIDLLTERLAGEQQILERERENARRTIKNREDLSLALRAIEQRDEKAQNDFFLGVQKIRDDANRRRDQSSLKIEQQLFAITEAQRQGELDAVKRALDKQGITEAAALTRQLEILKEAHAEKSLLIQAELEQLTTSAERKVELDNQKIESEQRFTNDVKRLTEERNDAREKEIASQAPGAQGIPEAGPLLFPELGEAPDQPIRNLNEALTELGATLGGLVGASEEFGQQFASVVGNAIADIAFAVGDLVHQWVLLGDTGPNAMRKLTASVLAGLAAQAAVKAIFQLAEGFAALFFNPAEAAAHFKSAALFGAVAGVAAVAGRSVAGDLFKSKSGGGAGASGRGGSGELNPLNLARNAGPGSPQQIAPQIIEHVHTFRIESNDSHIVKVISNDYRNGGRTRELILTDGEITY